MDIWKLSMKLQGVFFYNNRMDIKGQAYSGTEG